MSDLATAKQFESSEDVLTGKEALNTAQLASPARQLAQDVLTAELAQDILTAELNRQEEEIVATAKTPSELRQDVPTEGLTTSQLFKSNEDVSTAKETLDTARLASPARQLPQDVLTAELTRQEEEKVATAKSLSDLRQDAPTKGVVTAQLFRSNEQVKTADDLNTAALASPARELRQDAPTEGVMTAQLFRSNEQVKTADDLNTAALASPASELRQDLPTEGVMTAQLFQSNEQVKTADDLNTATLTSPCFCRAGEGIEASVKIVEDVSTGKEGLDTARMASPARELRQDAPTEGVMTARSPAQQTAKLLEEGEGVSTAVEDQSATARSPGPLTAKKLESREDVLTAQLTSPCLCPTTARQVGQETRTAVEDQSATARSLSPLTARKLESREDVLTAQLTSPCLCPTTARQVGQAVNANESVSTAVEDQSATARSPGPLTAKNIEEGESVLTAKSPARQVEHDVSTAVEDFFATARSPLESSEEVLTAKKLEEGENVLTAQLTSPCLCPTTARQAGQAANAEQETRTAVEDQSATARSPGPLTAILATSGENVATAKSPARELRQDAPTEGVMTARSPAQQTVANIQARETVGEDLSIEDMQTAKESESHVDILTARSPGQKASRMTDLSTAKESTSDEAMLAAIEAMLTARENVGLKTPLASSPAVSPYLEFESDDEVQDVKTLPSNYQLADMNKSPVKHVVRLAPVKSEYHLQEMREYDALDSNNYFLKLATSKQQPQ